MKKISLKIEGMSCSACSTSLEKYLNKQDGIKSAVVNLVLAEAQIEYDEKKLKLDDLDRFVSEAGFKSAGEFKLDLENKKDHSKFNLIFYLVILLVLMYISMSHMLKLPEIPYLGMMDNPKNYSLALFILTLFFFVYGIDILKSGIKNLVYRHPNMDSLVTVGVFASFIYSTINMILIFNGENALVDSLYFESCATVIYFIKLGRHIDNKSKEKTKEAIKQLVQITPEKAYKKVDNQIVEVTIDEVEIDDILVCKPGEKFAVDGVITKGSAHIDESFITGESNPSKKEKNSKVVAGSINIDGYIEYQAKKIGKNSTISEIVRLVIEASSTKAKISRIADTISSYFVPGIFIISILTFIGYLIFGTLNDGLVSFVTVLVVACPCAIGLATPLAIVVSEGVCAKSGILVKSSEILENASKIDTVIFDKTGTLTYGNLRISKIYNYSKMDDEEILKFAKAVEKQSSHPISKAFKDIKTDYLVDEFENIQGIGIKGIVEDKEIYIGNNKIFDKLKMKNNHLADEEKLTKELNSILYIVIDKKIVALLGVKDIIRDNVKKVITDLKKQNINVIMLSGDNKEVANFVGKSLGIDKVISNVLPEEKEEVINEELKNHKVMMVGDGINDALALSKATVAVSINSGTDIAIDTSDVILMNDDLNKIVKLIEISKKTIKIIKENLFWAFFYNIIMIPIAIGLFKGIGITLTPMFGSIAMTLSSLTVVLNSLRLRKMDKNGEV